MTPNKIEERFTDFILDTIPWSGPVPTAVVIYHVLSGNPLVGPYGAIAGAIAIEGIGFSANNIALKQLRKRGWKFQTILSVSAVVAYVAVAEVATAFAGNDPVLGVFPFVSLLAFIVAALRSDYKDLVVEEVADSKVAEANREREQALQREKEAQEAQLAMQRELELTRLKYQHSESLQRNRLELTNQPTNSDPTNQPNQPTKRRSGRRELIELALRDNPEATNVAIAGEFGVHENYVGRIRKEMNGNGTQVSD